jgi:aminopeptidase N
VDRVDLKFEIEEAQTRVHSRLVVKRNEKSAALGNLWLDGSAKLLSLTLDGERLSPIVTN